MADTFQGGCVWGGVELEATGDPAVMGYCHCKVCGGPLMTAHPGMGLVDVYAALMPDFTHVPAFHVFHEHRTILMKDGLPKFKDLPEDMGGSGEMLPD